MNSKLFPSEIFVTNCVKTSERAFSAVREFIPNAFDSRQMIKVLQSRQQLPQIAANERVPFEEIFVYFEKAILAAFNRRPTPRLTRRHAHLLLNADTQHFLGQKFNCDYRNVLSKLLSKQDLEETFKYVTDSPAMGWIPPTEDQLLTAILEPGLVQKLERYHGTNENNWEIVFVEEYWLSNEGKQLLAPFNKLRDNQTLYQTLADLIDQSQEDLISERQIEWPRTNNRSQEDPISEPKAASRRADTLRALGLLELRRRLAWIKERIHDQALEYAGNAAIGMPASSSIQVLLPILHMYEIGSVAKGLHAYINYTRPLEKLLPKNSFVGSEIDEEKIVGNRSLFFVGEPLGALADGQQVGSFEVMCWLKGQKNPQVILQASDVPEWVYRQLEQDIRQITPNVLSLTTGDDLYKRLLNTTFPILAPHIQLLKEAVNELGASFDQTVAMSLEKPIENIPGSWQEKLSTRLPYRDLPAENDPLYEDDVESIINRYGEYYRKPGDNLMIRRDNPFLDAQTLSP